MQDVIDGKINDMFEPVRYKSVKGDKIDIMLEKYVNTHNIRLPIQRLEPSKYLFGTKKVHAEIRNGVLMVRVGGGFMKIEEFIDKHAEKEIVGLRIRMKKQNKNLD
jgi:hypothetical protein